MKKKEFITESKRKKLLAEREKAIVETFTKTFNKIKRIDEGSETGIPDMIVTLDYDNNQTKIEIKHYHNGLDNSIESEVDVLKANFDFADTVQIVGDLMSKGEWGKIYVKVINGGEEHNDRIDSMYWKGLNYWVKNN